MAPPAPSCGAAAALSIADRSLLVLAAGVCCQNTDPKQGWMGRTDESSACVDSVNGMARIRAGLRSK